MPRTLNALTVLLFCAFLVLPLGLLAGLGAVAPYGQKNFTPFPEPKNLLHSSPTERKGLSTALFERSPASVFAIRTHNAALYRVTGTIDNEKMVSGQGDWLFYKDEFWNGKCLSDEVFATTLRTLDTMAAMAAAAGLPILFTVSPDKATVHPEKLGTRAAFYAGCKTQNGKHWRELAPRYAPQLLDHTAAILDPGNPKVPYFFATDTHWNSRAIALATSQLASMLGDFAPSAAVLYAGVPYSRQTDMRNRMLLLEGPESDEGVTSFRTPREEAKPILFITDSFYGVSHAEIAKAFPNSKFYDIENDVEAYGKALQDYSGQVVVNTVERALFRRFGDSDGAVARAIIDRNMARAQSCTFTLPVDLAAGATLEDIERTGPSSFQAKTDDPNVPIPALSNCVRISLEVDKDTEFQLYLPVLQGRDDEEDFSEGRSISVSLPAGKSVLNFVLPANRAGTELRIDPTNSAGPFTLSELSFGNLP